MLGIGFVDEANNSYVIHKLELCGPDNCQDRYCMCGAIGTCDCDDPAPDFAVVRIPHELGVVEGYYVMCEHHANEIVQRRR